MTELIATHEDPDDLKFTPMDIAEFDEIAVDDEKCHSVEESMSMVRGKLGYF